MRIKNLGGAPSVNSYVRRKLEVFERSEKSFETLFELMFRESGNTMAERLKGFKVIKNTYGEVKEDILLLAKALGEKMPEMISEKDSVCGIYMENSLLWIEIFWALIVSGVSPLLMNLLLDKKSLAKAAADCGCRFIICDGKKTAELLEHFPGIQIMSAEDVEGLKEQNRETYSGQQNGSSKKPFANEIIFMTSGTTENVKLCFYNAETFFHQISYSFEIIKQSRIAKRHYKGELKLLTFLPFYHIFGFVAVYLWFGFFSRTFVFLNDLSPETLTNTVRRRHVTHIFAVPLFWNKVYEGAMKKINALGPATAKRLEKGLLIAEALYRIPLIGTPLGLAFSKAAFKPVRRKLFSESISFMISGGGPLKQDVQRFFNLIGYRLVNGFGMTETGITSVELSNSIPYVIKGYVGKPLGKVSYRIEDGQLYVKGLVMADSIIENGVRKDLPEWFPTKDMAQKAGKSYRILGRADDLIIPESGENINPDMVEKHLFVEGVNEVCVIGDGNGATVVAEVSKSLRGNDLEDVRTRISERAFETPLKGNVTRIILTRDNLIPAGDFKVSRKSLKRRLEQGLINEVKPSDTANAVVTEETESIGLLPEIIEIIASCTGKAPSEFGPDTDLFADKGISSLDYFEIISEISRKYSGSMPVAVAGEKVTPAVLARAAEELQTDERRVET